MRILRGVYRTAWWAFAGAAVIVGICAPANAQVSEQPSIASDLRTSQEYRVQAVVALPDVDRLDAVDLALLADPHTDSPRATIATFRQNVEQAYRTLQKAYELHRESAGFGVSPEVAEMVKTAELLLRRAIACIDLSQVPAVNREKVGIETALLLKEILDRVPLPALDRIPDAAAVHAAEKSKPIKSWLLPYTDLRIVRIESGPQAGEFQFAADTVSQAEAFYNVVKEFSDQTGAQDDFFEFYTLTPGNLLPPKWYLWVETLPDWTRKPVLGQAIWQWAGMAGILLVLFGAYFALGRIRRRRAVAISPLRRVAGRLFMPLLLIAIAAYARHLIVGELNITGLPFVFANLGLYTIAYLAAAWSAYLVLLFLAEFVISSPRIDPAGIDASLLRIGARVSGMAIAIAVLFYGATTIGLPVYGVIAGLGVGGLALGLAARPTLENLIGGLILYADRPVRVGDLCQFGDKMGVVEEIGLRSTRIRSPDRTLITVPNAEFSNKELINMARRDQFLMKFMLGLRYETTTDQLNWVLDGLRTLFAEHPDVDAKSVRVRLRDLGAYSLDIEVRVYINKADMSDFLEVQEGLLLAVLDLVENSGAAIAFPSTTTYHVTDPASLSRPPEPAAG